LLLLSLAVGVGRADAAPREPVSADAGICRIIENTAAANQLPVGYLSRLLWTESRFDSGATSPAGAEGIAQFMPGTAAEQGLDDPWDPTSSIDHAARLLVNLHRRFGNLGLAAAAYNAGPGRLAGWLQGSSILPEETRLYVELVTGRPLGQWLEMPQASSSDRAERSCTAIIAEFSRNAIGLSRGGPGYAVPFAISSDGSLITRNTGGTPTVADRLAIHGALNRIVGLRSER
jgi:hypothetical protein